MFNSKPQYKVIQGALPICDVKDDWEESIVRPPLIGSRGTPIPKIVGEADDAIENDI
jgi:hypothetical protein